MGALFEELDWRPTPMGAVSLRRRHDPALGVEV
ncbi:MAG: spermidine synthase, partial [Actinomycetes bacterium]